MSFIKKLIIFTSKFISPKSSSANMTCEDASTLIANIKDISNDRKQEVLSHIKDCPCCGNYYNQILFLDKKCKEIRKFSLKESEESSSKSLKESKLEIIKRYSQ